MFGFGPMFPQGMQRNFNTKYRCYSVSMLPGQERTDVEKGGKIIMPPSALDMLTRLNIQYPMLFKLTNTKTGVNRETHCGVLEFVADEGRIYLPYWMMHNLLLEEGGLVQVENQSLPVATFAKFQPQAPDFLDITNPKAVLENALRGFACLTKGDIIAINYNEKIYEMLVMETKPGNAVSIIETDMNVDFEAPVGYKEPERVFPAQQQQQEEEDEPIDVSAIVTAASFRAFQGGGNRLDGKKKNTESSPSMIPQHEIQRGIPNYNYKNGKITFIRNSHSRNGETTSEEDKSFEAFSGSGQSLRKKPGRK